MNFLFTGLGSIATKHITDLVSITAKQNVECNIIALRRKAGDLPECLRSYNINQITELDSTVYDAAFITNPTNLHFKILEALKGRSSFYFIEKPIFENCNYDWKSLGIHEKNAYVACPMRHSDVYKKLREITEINKVFSVRIICSSYLPEWRPAIDYRRNYSASRALGGGVTLDLIHEIDYMVGLFGLPEKVYNIHGKYSCLEIDSDDLSVYIAQYKDLLCEVHLDYFGRKYQRTCELYTADGTYIADFKGNTILKPDGTVLACENDGKTNLYLEMEYFMDLVLGRQIENINTPAHGLEVLKVTLGESK